MNVRNHKASIIFPNKGVLKRRDNLRKTVFQYSLTLVEYFNHMFAEEVGALLIKKYRINPILLHAYFKNLNPQKDIG